MWENSFGNHRFYLSHLFKVVYATQANMVGTYVGYNSNIAMLKSKSDFKIPPRAHSNTAKSTVGSFNTNCALTGPVQSPFIIRLF